MTLPRRTILGVIGTGITGLAGCSQKQLPLTDVAEEPPIDSQYRFDRNELNVWHDGDEPLTHLDGHEIENISIIAFPADVNPHHGHGVAAMIENDDESTKGPWVDYRDHEDGLVDPPLEPGDEIFVTWYSAGGRLHELRSGDSFEVSVRIDGESFGYHLTEIP